MNKISACLVVYNEERNIGRCLESLRGVVEEIILVHDGPCQDRTLEIAKSFGAKIFIQPHQGEAEIHRPFSYEQTNNNWILQIDGDEFLSLELKNRLVQLISDETVSAYQFIWPLWNGRKAVSRSWPYKLCLFKKDKISFLGIPHFVPEVQGKVASSRLILEHQPDYNNLSFSIFWTKWRSWAKIQASCYLQDFKTINRYNWSGQEWPKKISLRRRFPLLLLPLEFLLVLFNNVGIGVYRAGFYGLKLAILSGLYRAVVNYYIFKLKK